MVWDLPEVRHNWDLFGGPHPAKMHTCTYCDTKADRQPTQSSAEHSLMEMLDHSLEWTEWYDHYHSIILFLNKNIFIDA